MEDGHDDAYELLTRSRFGRAADLRRSLTFLHLSGRLANLVYSMETTNVDFYAYQYKPVLSFLESPSNGLLIADEVGLAKTIEAGLIWTELRARYDARRLVVFCPAMLREKWRDELRERFGVDAVIIATTSKSDEVIHQAANMCRQRGEIVLVGTSGLNLRRDDFYEKEISFKVSCSYGPGRYDSSYEDKGIDYPVGWVWWSLSRSSFRELSLKSIVKPQNVANRLLETIELPQLRQMPPQPGYGPGPSPHNTPGRHVDKERQDSHRGPVLPIRMIR